MRPVLILFAKAPVPGRVKTRLAASIGAAAAAELHRAFVEDMLDLIGSLGDVADAELHTDAETDAWRDSGVSRRLQAPGDLGSKMLHALSAALEEGRRAACIVGSDAPSLPAEHLRALLDSPADVTLGPAGDGGYYAIACRRVHAGMFQGVEWSSARVLEQTGRASRKCGLSVALGPAWWDVDEFEDLRRLAASAAIPPRTRAWLAAHAGLLR